MNFTEEAVGFYCGNDRLHGIASIPQAPFARGVLIVVGGPQYRVGSHRQFVLLARFLAAHGIAVFRFDYRGMGDSEGPMRNFEEIHEDVRAAVDSFKECVPAVKEFVLWGLCDAASAALLYAGQDRRVTGLVLLNPWVRTEQGIAATTLKHYYRARVLEWAFWAKVLRGRFDYAAAAKSFATLWRKAFSDRDQAPLSASQPPLPQRMLEGLRDFYGPILLITSGKDLTAKEFLETVNGSRDWRHLIDAPRITRREAAAANHTFSRQEWRDQVATWTLDWIKAW